jgi:hypothetical protein
MSATTYPVRVDASLDAPLSRWLWMVKWVLAIPHYVVLGFLWIAFAVLSIAAFFAILFTGRYPRSIFDFNVGVLRWTWRVQYYSYGALGTDKYPPFSLHDDPGYPAHLSVEYPQRLSRGLVLVKWWLLAIPHYIIVGLFAGGGAVAATRIGDQQVNWAGGGLIGILVVVAAVILLVTGRYPDPIFGFVLGMNRWVLRVAAYASLMTDEYPPFRLDVGGSDPGGPDHGGSAVRGAVSFQAPPPVGIAAPPSDAAPLSVAGLEPPDEPGGRRGSGWTAGRIISVIGGSVMLLFASGLLAGGGGVLWADQVHRTGGFVTSGSQVYTTPGHALVTETIQIPGSGLDRIGRDMVGKVRIRVSATNPSRPVFVGIARAGDVARYLAGSRYTTLHNIGSATSIAITTSGTATPADPATAGIWTAQSAGPGTRTLIVRVTSGNWAIVVMNRDAAAGLTVRADVGANLPVLPWIAGGMLGGGALFAGIGVLLLVIPVRRASS